jgi:hypothetical protein
VKNLDAHVELHAKVLDLVELHVGADVKIEEVNLDIDNVRVQAMLKVKLEKVAEILSRVMDTIDKNPEILTNLTAGVGRGVENALSGNEKDGDGKDSDGWSQSPELSGRPEGFGEHPNSDSDDTSKKDSEPKSEPESDKRSEKAVGEQQPEGNETEAAQPEAEQATETADDSAASEQTADASTESQSDAGDNA